MLKKYIITALFIGIACFVVAAGTFATEELEEEEEQIQQEREEIQSQISEAESALVNLVSRIDELNRELSNLNNSIARNEEMIVKVEEKIIENKLEVKGLEADIELFQEDIDQRNELLKDRAVSYQRNGTDNVSFIEVILGAESFGDFVSRLFMISRIAQADSNFIEQLETNQHNLLEVQGEYEETLLELDDQLLILQILNEDILEQREKTIGLMDEVKANEAEHERLISQLMAEDENLASQEDEIRSRIAEEVRLQEEARLQEEVRLAAERQAASEAKAREEAERESNSNNESENENNTESPSSTSSSNNANWETFIATAYTAYCTGCSGITFTGIDLRANPDAQVIAVDPNVIPLGSMVEVQGYGTFLAADIGGAINGRKIDIFMPDRNDVINFGVRAVQIRVLD
ncbi:3D (Asp-Asp-Asp) domain-containing protein/peptidoglycan hydrolase CwlO-like protein [Evansella vedderi]|uniref:3D (Asp-Asp-Asp) domain-containing protein/peptidoglycan hydrolase CwlO-like protein n=1 Tax=Evansella vedderi TaxID=38282 RepID=A0ABT9ZV88_9BACI|nr:3D domain-containing protein [Evansella vedderi]MDQ0254855.1 3D (Asp-Asp-Asp) domain-containing protein/peptidoglycan hydrolase CwlO-like protein [Evansella vedderi]